jgi:hypothetical protein
MLEIEFFKTSCITRPQDVGYCSYRSMWASTSRHGTCTTALDSNPQEDLEPPCSRQARERGVLAQATKGGHQLTIAPESWPRASNTAAAGLGEEVRKVNWWGWTLGLDNY